ncbi:hypothetical protein Q4519_17350 [Motilimonas sp. 1_MG-2023]|uniref:hypothetical protein n=1 Tax=Motilimonas sp. 1_MG-2023 TaxID=3062672 RepID=UPI0026E3C193|nr:hypothetical protein [Motilimonas sp. 1_MG-2023]MDO6527449.1 hypothetical protein [Motilimonas sp. 1_MG-2023]
MTRAKEYKKHGIGILKSLESQLDANKGYPEEPTWGYAFSLLAALENNSDLSSNDFAKIALKHYCEQEKDIKSFSWEFTTYALFRAEKLSGSTDLAKLSNLNEKGTRMVNWTLLRQLNRLNAEKKQFRAKFILRCIRKIFTSDEGQIFDELNTKSLQYHAFCLFILAELDAMGYQTLVRDWLIRGCQFSKKMMLKSGMSLYIGRGQEQIFGYASLIYALEYAEKYCGLARTSHLETIWNYLAKFQRSDGSYPLVLNLNSPEKPMANYARDKPAGWLGYNTLYDYQPFLAYCLLRASKL